MPWLQYFLIIVGIEAIKIFVCNVICRSTVWILNWEFELNEEGWLLSSSSPRLRVGGKAPHGNRLFPGISA